MLKNKVFFVVAVAVVVTQGAVVVPLTKAGVVGVTLATTFVEGERSFDFFMFYILLFFYLARVTLFVIRVVINN